MLMIWLTINVIDASASFVKTVSYSTVDQRSCVKTVTRGAIIKYYKFLQKGTYRTLFMGTELPPPGQFSSPIINIQPSGSAGFGSGVGYHMYSEDVLPFITGGFYNNIADLWIVQTRGQTKDYLMIKDPPASVFPPRPVKCVVAESIELVEKVPFIVEGGILKLL